MNYIVIAICIIFGLAELHKKRYDSPLCFFLLMWFVTLIADIIHIKGINRVSNSLTYQVVALGITGVVIGYLLGGRYRITIHKNRITTIRHRLNGRLVNILLVASTLIMIPYFLFGISMLVTGQFELVKVSYYTGANVRMPYILKLIFIYVARPVIYAGNTFFALELINETNRPIRFIHPVALLVYYISTGMRMAILFAFISVVFAFLVRLRSSHEQIIKQQLTRQRRLIIIFAIVMVVLITSTGHKLMESLYSYTAAALIGMDVKLSSLTENFIHTNGAVSFNGYIHLIVEVLEMLGISGNNIVDLAQEYIADQQYTIYIGDGVRFNAFYTMFYNEYLDGGLPGVFLLSAIFGIWIKLGYTNYKKRMDDRTVCMYLITMIFVMSTVTRYPFTDPTMALSVVYIYLFTRKSLVRIETEER